MSANPPPADDEERTTARGLWRYAYDYLRAANRLDEIDPDPAGSSQVSYHLACHALEVAFKAYLRAKGARLDDLKRHGHSLESVRVAAEAQGLPQLSDELREALAMVESYHREHEFRYIRTGTKHYPPLSDLVTAGAKVLDASADAVGHAVATSNHAQHIYRMKFDVSATFGRTNAPPSPTTPHSPPGVPSSKVELPRFRGRFSAWFSSEFSGDLQGALGG